VGIVARIWSINEPGGEVYSIASPFLLASMRPAGRWLCLRGRRGVCLADLTGDGEINFFDVSAFLSAFAAQDSAADFTGDGEFNFFDVSAFLTAFGEGCP